MSRKDQHPEGERCASSHYGAASLVHATPPRSLLIRVTVTADASGKTCVSRRSECQTLTALVSH